MSARPGPAGGPLGFRHKRVQRVRRLLAQHSYREAERAFVVEGGKLVGEALRAGAPVEGVYVAPDGLGDEVISEVERAGIRIFLLAPGVIERVTDTVTPQPVVAVVGRAGVVLDDLQGADPLVVCVDVRDPGNLGTVLRTAEASGVGGVICCDGTVDVYNPKCVRASAGSVFHIRVVAGGDPVEVLGQVGSWGLRRLGTAARAGVPYDRADLTSPTALVMGNEANGLPETVTPCIDEWVSIPMAGRAESLNVGMAAAVLCFEVARQRGR